MVGYISNNGASKLKVGFLILESWFPLRSHVATMSHIPISWRSGQAHIFPPGTPL